jgi:hypothetical protein
MTELAERPLPGFPGAKVALHVEDRDYTVVITDPEGDITWKPITKADASSMYVHPFCHGYTYRSGASGATTNYDEEDGA